MITSKKENGGLKYNFFFCSKNIREILKKQEFKHFNKGVTLIEMLVVVSVFLIMLALFSLNLFNLPTSATSTSLKDTLITDVKSQQIKAMVGDTEGRDTQDEYGIYFSNASYTLFHGAVYNQNDPDNFVTSLPSGYSETSTFPNSTIIFSKGSGEISNFTPSQDSITFTDTVGKSITIRLNKYGTIISVN